MSESTAPSALFAARSMSQHNRAEMRQIFDHAIRLAERNRIMLRVPHEVRPVQNKRGMHYHYRPEIFIGVRGWTDFNFPKESFRVAPDEVCVIPAGVPHGERVGAAPGESFRNLVAGFYNNTLSIHLAHEAKPGKPDIEVIEFFDAPNLDVFLTLANSIASTHNMHGPARDAVLQGLVLALLGLLRNIVETGSGQLNSDIGKVFQAKCLVREQFANPDLSVQHVAEVLGCSADYLSHLFHTETKERLTHYIQRIRIDGAILALETTKLTISEIAYASGFADPAYFARVFKQHKGVTPQEFRAQLDARRKEQEQQPKTVYYDHVDFTHGVPHKKEEPTSAAKGREATGDPATAFER
ncbi:MAG: AraC family transcriptional regulator [Candidatus Didemnitutus sp.]|nr:AraC family transcriptional regulator [Candidatus Didemnitutus sp.]